MVYSSSRSLAARTACRAKRDAEIPLAAAARWIAASSDRSKNTWSRTRSVNSAGRPIGGLRARFRRPFTTSQRRLRDGAKSRGAFHEPLGEACLGEKDLAADAPGEWEGVGMSIQPADGESRVSADVLSRQESVAAVAPSEPEFLGRSSEPRDEQIGQRAVAWLVRSDLPRVG